MASSSTINEHCTIRDQFNIHASGGYVNIPVTNNSPQEIEFDFPRLIDTFHGREQEFNRLDELFFSENNNKIVLHGLPGYGKTELSKQYAQHCIDIESVTHAFWIKAENEDELKKSFVHLKKIYKKYKDVSCMFVFDNALNRNSISEYEPSNKKHKMLVTSHVADMGHGVESLLVGPLTSEPVTQIFKKILEGKYREEDHILYEELGDFVDNVPLGVQILAGYVRQRMKSLKQRFQFKDCVEEIKKRKIIKDKFYKNNPNLYQKSIYDALTVSLYKIKEEDIEIKELAITVLYVCAFLSPDTIHCNYLLTIPSIIQLIGDKNSELELISAITLLENFSFVNYYSTTENRINIHRLVQSFLRQYLSSRDCDLDDKKCYSVCAYTMFYFGDDYINIFPEPILYNSDERTVGECIEFLEQVFYNINGTKFIYEYNLFYNAATLNRIEVIDFLLPYAEINTNYNGHEVMFRVASTGNENAVLLLIERGVDVNNKNGDNRTPVDSLLHKLTSGSDSDLKQLSMQDPYLPFRTMSILPLLLECGATFDTSSLNEERQFLLLSSAVLMNKTELLNTMIQHGFDVNSSAKADSIWKYDNNSALHEAASQGSIEIIKMLISAGAVVKTKNENDETALFKFVEYAAYENMDNKQLSEILDLMNCKKHANDCDKRNRNLLHRAGIGTNSELITLLVETYGCEVNKQDDKGDTPLHKLISWISKFLEYPIEDIEVDIVRTLIQCGAILTIQNNRQQTRLEQLKLRCKKWNCDLLLSLLKTTTNTETEHSTS